MTNIKLEDKARKNAETFKMVILLGAVGIFISAIILLLVTTQPMEKLIFNSLLIISILNLGFSIGMIAVGVKRLMVLKANKVTTKELDTMKKAAQYMLQSGTNILPLTGEETGELAEGHAELLKDINNSLSESATKTSTVSLIVYEGQTASKTVNVTYNPQHNSVVMA